jgi:hypothetical protein
VRLRGTVQEKVETKLRDHLPCYASEPAIVEHLKVAVSRACFAPGAASDTEISQPWRGLIWPQAGALCCSPQICPAGFIRMLQRPAHAVSATKPRPVPSLNVVGQRNAEILRGRLSQRWSRDGVRAELRQNTKKRLTMGQTKI